MSKKRVLSIIILAIISVSILYACGGGGGASLSGPDSGLIPGNLSISVIPSLYAVKVGGIVQIYAKVIDSYGRPLPNETIIFQADKEEAQIRNVINKTTSSGVAVASISYNQEGYVKVTAKASSTGQIDSKMVYFHDSDFFRYNININPVSVIIDVDGNKNGVFNEPVDFELCNAPGTNEGNLRVKVYNFNKLQPFTKVNIGSDATGDVVMFHGAGMAAANAVSVTTDKDGYAYLNMIAKCPIQTSKKVINILADTPKKFFPEFNRSFSGNGATSMYLSAVRVKTVTLSVYPKSLMLGETAQVRAVVETTAGVPPDGSLIQFSSTCGVVDPSVATLINGVATTTLRAPSIIVDGSKCIVYGFIGGVTGEVTVDLSNDLMVYPDSVSLVANDDNGKKIDVIVKGGRKPYSVSSSSPYVTAVLNENDTITITVVNPSFEGNAVITVRDSGGKTVKVNVAVTVNSAPQPPVLTVVPSTINIKPGGSATAIVSGGVEPYIVVSGHYAITATIVGNVVTITSTDMVWQGNAVVTIRDSKNNRANINVTVKDDDVVVLPLSVLPSTINLKKMQSYTASISGGIPPYLASSEHYAVSALVQGSSLIVSSTDNNWTGTTKVTVKDNKNTKVDVTVIVSDDTSPLSVSPSSLTILANGQGTITIFGGVAPYSAYSNHFGIVATVSNNIVTVKTSNGTWTGNAVVTIKDSIGNSVDVNITSQ